MSAPAFTPGPWLIEACDDAHGMVSIGTSYEAKDEWRDFARVVVRMDGDPFDNPQGAANARLIAAAPDGHKIIAELVASDEATGWLPENIRQAALAYLAKVAGQ